MSRSGYIDGCELQAYELNLWRGAVDSAIRGRRGQALLRDMIAALDALPDKWLSAESLRSEDGEYCALGAVGSFREINMEEIDDWDYNQVAKAFNIAPALAREIVYLNDEYAADERIWMKHVICGPVRPQFPDWGKHTIETLEPNPNAGLNRWKYMRKWAEDNLHPDRSNAT